MTPWRARNTGASAWSALAWAGLCAAAAANAAPAAAPQNPGLLPHARVIVGFKADAPTLREQALSKGMTPATVSQRAQARAERLSPSAGVSLKAGRSLDERTQVLSAQGIDAAALAKRLARHPEVAFVQVDRPVRHFATPPNDPLYAAGPSNGRGPAVGQWYLRAPDGLFRSAANAAGAWTITQGRSDLVVAVLDTGVRYDHEDLAGRLLPGHDMVTGSAGNDATPGRDNDANDPGDWCTSDGSNSSWHGTKVAGIVGAATNNGIGMAGTAPNVRILPVRVLGQCGGFESDVIAGMYWAAGIAQPGLPASSTPAKVLNLSLGSDGACGNADANAVAAVVARGVSVIVAAGNTAGRAVNSPANCPGAVGVLALRHAGTKVGFSDLGPEISIAAPGGNCVNVGAGQACLYPILSSTNSGTQGPNAGGSTYTDSFNTSVGTSFSSPIVAGAVALMLSVRPNLSPAEVRQLLRSTARPFPDSGADNGTDPTPVGTCRPPANSDQLQCYCTTDLCGAGMLDIGSAVAAALGGLQARIGQSPAEAVAGSAVQLDGSGSLLGAGRSVSTWLWELVDGGGIANGFSTATNAATASITPSGAGTLRVRLTVTDDLGATASVERTINVAAAPPAPPSPPVNPPPATPPASSGGGVTSTGWLLGLLWATWLLHRGTGRASRR
jgi:serine protease